MTVKRNTEGLLQSVQKKRQEALDKVEQGIRQLLKGGKPINFNTVAQAADVSKAFLYKELEIKERIEQLRQQGTKSKPEPKQRASDASKDAIIKTLRDRVKKLEVEVKELRRQNEIAYGQILETNSMRQQLGRLQTENDRLRQQLVTTRVGDLPGTNISDFETEVRSLGVDLNSTITKLIQEVPPEATRRAIESLREAITERRVENRAGFLNKAIRDAWKPNEAYEKKIERSVFNEWYVLAQKAGLVQAATLIEGVQHVLTAQGEWVLFIDLLELYPIGSLAK